MRLADRHPRLTTAAAAGAGAAAAGAVAGPVAAVISAVYVTAGTVVYLSRRRAAADAAAFQTALAAVAAVAADLRAGADPGTAVARSRLALTRGGDIADLSGRVNAAARVADESGAPLADLLERLEGEGRTLSRARGAAAAQASGAQATAWLLAALPAAGVALGEGVGTDPLHVLFHTPIGAACAGGAMMFQVAGLTWVHRLAASIMESA
jgi:tight adherence protein B